MKVAGAAAAEHGEVYNPVVLGFAGVRNKLLGFLDKHRSNEEPVGTSGINTLNDREVQVYFKVGESVEDNIGTRIADIWINALSLFPKGSGCEVKSLRFSTLPYGSVVFRMDCMLQDDEDFQ